MKKTKKQNEEIFESLNLEEAELLLKRKKLHETEEEDWQES